MILFRHINLESSEGQFNGLKVEVKQNIKHTWDVWVDGQLTKPNGFISRKMAIECIQMLVSRINGELPPTHKPTRPVRAFPNRRDTSKNQGARR